jgi:4'-phosphopantetheinyl transferase
MLIDFRSLPCASDELIRWETWLNPDEQGRFQAYRFQKDKDLFVARRGLAREIVGRLTHQPAERIDIQSLSSGNLYATMASQRLDLRLSVSKTKGWIACGACWEQCLGIDIEAVRPLEELDQLVSLHLTDCEKIAWNNLASCHQLDRYYRLWVVKEATLKAIGLGLQTPTTCIECVSAIQGELQGFVTIKSMPDEFQLHYRLEPLQQAGSTDYAWRAIAIPENSSQECKREDIGLGSRTDLEPVEP